MKILSTLKDVTIGTVAFGASCVASATAKAATEVYGNGVVDSIADKLDEKKPRYHKKGFAIYQDKRNGSSVKLKGKAKKAAKQRIKLGK